ncbi:MAG: 3-hydroxyacyl-CoA dehydrogenase NAD-binding domain-containing protein [Bacteroidota bacterium]
MQQIKTIAVCGAGTMGTGIAQLCVQSGYPTILFDVQENILQRSKDAMQESWKSLLIKGKISQEELQQFESLLKYSSDINDCVADLVIEAIVEKASVKLDLFHQLAANNSIKTILVSNTSSISINAMQAKLEDSFRFAGMHFFNPATHMKLVEIVRGDQTTEAVVKMLQEVAIRLGKTAVVCKDSPGFIVNRVARHYYLESLYLLEQGKVDVATIDQVLESTGFKMGAFRLMDLIGIDINYAVSKIIWEDLGKPKRLIPSILQEEKIEKQDLGRKTGAGFYKYYKEENN